MKYAGIQGPLLAWFENYLSDRYQRVVLPGDSSDLVCVRAGVPQGSILGPLLFFVYINDIVKDIGYNINLFADDTCLSMVVNNPNVAGNLLQSDIDKVSLWANRWLVSFNPRKSESLIFSRKRNKPSHPGLFMFNTVIPTVRFHKDLGIVLTDDGSWDNPIDQITAKARKRRHIMRRLKLSLDRQAL